MTGQIDLKEAFLPNKRSIAKGVKL
jgi:hypothetical protein